MDDLIIYDELEELNLNDLNQDDDEWFLDHEDEYIPYSESSHKTMWDDFDEVNPDDIPDDLWDEE